MTSRGRKDIAASVRQRLLNKAKAERRPFNEFLQYYAMERFLFRLSKSPHADKFVLKGALMLRAWRSPEPRPTMDIDLLGKTSNDVESIVNQVRGILAVEVESDGLVFDAATIQAERIVENADYEGIRIRFRGTLGSAVVTIQLDIGFGDVIFPGPERLDFPSLLGDPVPCLLGYSRESAIAEKFEAMLKLRELNSRMKDFYDIWLLARQFDFEGAVLAEAIRRTLEKRATALPEEVTIFATEFIDAKRVQWTAFRKRLNDYGNTPEDFAEVLAAIREFLSPVVMSLRSGTEPPHFWSAPGPWK